MQYVIMIGFINSVNDIFTDSPLFHWTPFCEYIKSIIMQVICKIMYLNNRFNSRSMVYIICTISIKMCIVIVLHCILAFRKAKVLLPLECLMF